MFFHACSDPDCKCFSDHVADWFTEFEQHAEPHECPDPDCEPEPEPELESVE